MRLRGAWASQILARWFEAFFHAKLCTVAVSVQRLFASHRASVLGVCLWVSSALGTPSCYFADTPDWSPYPPSPPFQPEPEPEPESYEDRAARLPPAWSEQEKVEWLLVSYCGECHTADACGDAASCDGFFFIDDFERLAEEGKILPGKPEDSQLVELMAIGNMPPGNVAPPELIDRVSAFIATLCSADDSECQTETDDGD